jgi:aminoglycoside phosphotransferase (APT) family kinase protein
VRTVVELHRLPAEAPSEEDAIATTFDRWSTYLDWATGEGSPLEFMEGARKWCERNRPRIDEPPSVLWGDVQLTNAVFAADGAVAALLDWEMTTVGPPEVDLGWFLALHEMTVEQNSSALPGIPTRSEMLDAYEAALGRRVHDLRWFEVFALMRSGSIMIRMARILAAQGVDDGWLRTHNPTVAALERVLARG